MRALGLFLVILGVLAFAFPAYHFLVPEVSIADFDIRVLGGLLLGFGGVVLGLTRER